MCTFTDANWGFVTEGNEPWDICEDVAYSRLGVLGDFAEPYSVGFNDLFIFTENWLIRLE